MRAGQAPLRGPRLSKPRGSSAAHVWLGLWIAVAFVAFPAASPAAPVTGKHATVESRFTTKLPGTPTGSTFIGRYRAAGDPDADPPYMRGMTFYFPRGMRRDTSVPARCRASDLELQVRGAAACPAESRLGGGEVQSKFLGFPSNLQLDVFNNTHEVIMLARSPFVGSLTRGKIGRDGSVAFRSPTCFPTVHPVGCPADFALQLGSQVTLDRHVSTSGGVRRSYMTTPSSCPRSGRWRTRVRFWWADRSEETVVSRQPCRRRARRAR